MFPSQVHCISTEFTPRKHGGEKGVPFRVQIDTFKQNENGEYAEHLHSASCQIKVFKVGTASPRPLCPCPQDACFLLADSDADVLAVSREARQGASPGLLPLPAPWDGVPRRARLSASSIACVCAHCHFTGMSAFAHLKTCVFLPRKHLDLPSSVEGKTCLCSASRRARARWARGSDLESVCTDLSAGPSTRGEQGRAGSSARGRPLLGLRPAAVGSAAPGREAEGRS